MAKVNLRFHNLKKKNLPLPSLKELAREKREKTGQACNRRKQKKKKKKGKDR